LEDFEKELKLGFLDEAAQSLADVEQCFLSLESDPENSENLNKIFRLAHNLKGSSKAVGFNDMGAFTHEFETFILKIKNSELKATPQVVNLLLRCNDHLIQMVEALKGDLNATFDSSLLLQEMQNLKEQKQEIESSTESTVEESIESNHELIAELEAQIAVKSEPVLNQEVTVKNNPEPIPSPEPIKLPDTVKTEPAIPAAAKNNAPEESIRVSVKKLETLLNYVGEMVILQSVMREQAQTTNSLLLKKTVNQLGKVGKEIQDISMSLRMVPVKPTFQKMQRIVRDTALALNKDVGITLAGEDTELDKTVLEKINDPLVHLIRNSVDHGIENQEIRIARNKPLKGSVTLSAFHQSGKLVIEVKDDGGGLDPEKLKKKAIEKGIIKASQVLTEKECLNLIFAPGFSTKEQVTDVSGRGVGMDVVRSNIQELSGEIQIESKVGIGSTFKINLPLTLAIIDGMVLTYSTDKFVIPLNHVHETLQPKENQVQAKTGLGEILLLRGENIPIFRLGDFFNLKSEVKNEEMIAMVVRTGPEPFAILVDDIIGQYQVVIKQLGPELQSYKGVSGSTILGDGKPALILEPIDLVKRKHVPVPISVKNEKIVGGKSA
jgi:two-component system chemotaxis sensor kinase CheA